MKNRDLKHLTLKTAFLLALAAGKRLSEIHARVANKVSNLGQWDKVALRSSSDFIAKNQLAREGSQSVFPVTIPGLTTIVDRQFKEDRTLCLVRALRYYLDRTQRPERISIPTFYFLQERTYLIHQTHYTLLLVKTNYHTLLQTSRSTVLGLSPSESACH